MAKTSLVFVIFFAKKAILRLVILNNFDYVVIPAS